MTALPASKQPPAVRMGNAKNPLVILGIRADADPVVSKAAYRALTKKFHPDMNPRSLADECHRKMLELNWAMDALAQGSNRWASSDADERGASADDSGRKVPSIVVEPRLIKLRGSPGTAKLFTATAGGIAPARIRARFYAKSWITIQRLDSNRSIARFSVSVNKEFRSRDSEAHDEVIEVSASGAQTAHVFVVISPLLAQEYDGRRIIPTREARADAIISFGKHKGRTFSDVAHDDPRYLEWVVNREAGTELERESARMALKSHRPRARSAA